MFVVVHTSPPRTKRILVVLPQYGSPMSKYMVVVLSLGSVAKVPYIGFELATLPGLTQNEIVAEAVFLETYGNELIEALEPL